MKFESMMFMEGGCGPETAYVCRKDKYTIEAAVEEAVLESYEVAEVTTTKTFHEVIKDVNPEEFVSVQYIRFYPNMPEGGWEIESGWTYCAKAKGAIEVWNVDIEKMIEIYRDFI